ncbi:hypothetical protein BGW38_000799 [Lunasporangiospora selenospora]|uniref:Uncharacterized protein n=1 Tax=Lunasporangiospora selenospora TaxID=979761 RepID=A0A9P6KEJ9_9FUNG|nr:hypothetical protein BGW38_000799 [Lunasporangiospora selenospora]
MMPRPIQQMYSISQGYQVTAPSPAPGVSAPERTKRHHRRSVDRIWPPALEVKIARLALDELHGQRSDHTGGEIHSDGDDTIMTSEGEAGRGTPSKRLKGQDHNASPQWKLPQQELTQSPSVARRHPLSPLLWDHTTGGCHIIPRAPPLPKSQEDQHIDEDLHTDDELEHDDDENYQRPQTITATMPAQDARTTSSVYMKSSASTPASWVSSASPSTCSTSPWFYPKGQIKVQYRRPCRSQKAYMLHSLELGLSKIADSCSEDENEQDPDLGPLEAHRYHRHRSGRGDTGLEQDSIDQEQERLYELVTTVMASPAGLKV